MKKEKAIIFDLDGTLLDTLKDIQTGLNLALEKYQYPICTLKQVREYVGNGLANLCALALPEGRNNPDFENVLALLRKEYKNHLTDQTSPYDGINELLIKLKQEGYLLGVLSNKPNQDVVTLIDYYFPKVFDFAQGEIEGIRIKPYPDAIEMILKKYSLSKDKVIYIGDSEVDILTAENANIKQIIVDWGFRDRAILEKNHAKCIVSSTDELLIKIMES